MVRPEHSTRVIVIDRKKDIRLEAARREVERQEKKRSKKAIKDKKEAKKEARAEKDESAEFTAQFIAELEAKEREHRLQMDAKRKQLEQLMVGHVCALCVTHYSCRNDGKTPSKLSAK